MTASNEPWAAMHDIGSSIVLIQALKFASCLSGLARIAKITTARERSKDSIRFRTTALERGRRRLVPATSYPWRVSATGWASTVITGATGPDRIQLTYLHEPRAGSA